jgi:hypothetical protein
LAERQGFEPWEGFPSTVFKTAAFDHSATSPEHEYPVIRADPVHSDTRGGPAA